MASTPGSPVLGARPSGSSRRARSVRRAIAVCSTLLAIGFVVLPPASQARGQAPGQDDPGSSGDSGSSTTSDGSGTSGASGGNGQRNTGQPGNGDNRGGALPSEGTRATGAASKPSGSVAYVTADRRVWIGTGNGKPVQVGALAALGANGQAAVAVSPTGERLAYVRADGALMLVGSDGTGSTALATNVSLDAVGGAPILSWDGTGKRIAYVAKGTKDEVQDSSTRARSSAPGSYLTQLPTGELGDVLTTVQVDGSKPASTGDPSVRSIFGVVSSLTDPIMVVQSRIPNTADKYTLALAAEGLKEVSPTPFSADAPDFSPDGSFLVGVGPAKGLREMIRVDLDDLSRTVLASDETICSPIVSPDSTRIVYGGGPHCNRLMLVSSKGGKAFDITPLDAPDTASYGEAALGWTTDGKFVAFPNCTTVAKVLGCSGPSVFLEPDTGRVLDGPDAVTVAPIRRTLIQDIWVDFHMRGPIDLEESFLISPETQASLTDTESGDILEATLTDGQAVMDVRLTASDNGFVAGTMKMADPAEGVNRTFTVLGRGSLLGLRIVSMSGIWMSTNDLPFATGQFAMAIRRR